MSEPIYSELFERIQEIEDFDVYDIHCRALNVLFDHNGYGGFFLRAELEWLTLMEIFSVAQVHQLTVGNEAYSMLQEV